MKKGQIILANLIFVFIVFLFLPLLSFSQERLNADSLFFVAHENAVAGNYNNAIRLADQILESYPEYTDARILKARTLAWDKKYDSAINEIDKVLQKEEDHMDANSALCDFYLWKGNYDSTIIAANKALKFYPDEEAFLIRKAQAELELGNFDETLQTAQLITERYPDNQQAKDIYQLLKMRSWKNEIRLEHYFDMFDQPYRRRWHMSSVGYGRKTSIGVFYGKVYLGDMVKSGETLYSSGIPKQFSLECYPKINKYNYFFVNYSYSPDELFPKNRVGLEYYHVFKNKFEFSLGYRYLQFSPDLGNDVNINIFTGSLGRYMGNWWISARPYIIDNGQDVSYKYAFELRNYFRPEVSYVELTVGTGTSPDNPAFYAAGAERAQLDSWQVGLEWKQRLSKLISIELEAGYENAEYEAGKQRDMLMLRSSLSFLF